MSIFLTFKIFSSVESYLRKDFKLISEIENIIKNCKPKYTV